MSVRLKKTSGENYGDLQKMIDKEEIQFINRLRDVLIAIVDKLWYGTDEGFADVWDININYKAGYASIWLNVGNEEKGIEEREIEGEVMWHANEELNDPQYPQRVANTIFKSIVEELGLNE